MDQPLEGKKQPGYGQQLRKPRILLAPLDWGLGHATRCIPIIRELIKQECEVWIAAEGAQESLLKTEFPQLSFLHLQGYRVKYARSKAGLLWQMLIQSPKFLQVIKKEYEWLKKAVDKHHFDIVISDNRYGLHHSKIPCVFITHQLTIKSPLGKWSESFLQKKNYSYINQFVECWVPDTEENGLAGELSHPQKLPGTKVQYIGSLSRFTKTNFAEINDHLLFILSGPEPQRTVLENKVVDEVSQYNGTATIVRGLPADHSLIPSTNMIRFYNHLPADALNDEMQKAEYIISRTGYSTVMDIAALQKKSILIPTPGQTEQEYLGEYLSAKQFAVCVSQKEFSLTNELQKAKQYAYRFPDTSTNNKLQQVIRKLIASIQ
jgi:uncharacterized protein (TIGR00661 family)